MEGLLVLLWTGEVLSIQFLQTHEKVAETSEKELAAVDPVEVTLTLSYKRSTHTKINSTNSLPIFLFK